MKTKLIAPCGMNCGICKYYLQDKCPGCYKQEEKEYCRKCTLRNCTKKKRFCLECGKPCQRLKNLDKRYRTKYGMSMLENLEFIKEHGVRKFVAKEKVKWACPGGVRSCHDGKCYKKK